VGCCARVPLHGALRRADRRAQFETHRAIAQAIGPDPALIIRTLDVGDKPLACRFPRKTIPSSANAGEGGLDRPEILRTQSARFCAPPRPERSGSCFR
jgi:hypothetical protein